MIRYNHYKICAEGSLEYIPEFGYEFGVSIEDDRSGAVPIRKKQLPAEYPSPVLRCIILIPWDEEGPLRGFAGDGEEGVKGVEAVVVL